MDAYVCVICRDRNIPNPVRSTKCNCEAEYCKECYDQMLVFGLACAMCRIKHNNNVFDLSTIKSFFSELLIFIPLFHKINESSSSLTNLPKPIAYFTVYFMCMLIGSMPMALVFPYLILYYFLKCLLYQYRLIYNAVIQ